jgi:hypothetical protein
MKKFPVIHSFLWVMLYFPPVPHGPGGIVPSAVHVQTKKSNFFSSGPGSVAFWAKADPARRMTTRTVLRFMACSLDRGSLGFLGEEAVESSDSSAIR